LLCDLCICIRPGLQIQLAEEILKLGKPTILVLIHGGAMSLGHLKEEYPAIVDAFYGGEMGGELTN
jgi:beta-glucosidase